MDSEILLSDKQISEKSFSRQKSIRTEKRDRLLREKMKNQFTLQYRYPDLYHKGFVKLLFEYHSN